MITVNNGVVNIDGDAMTVCAEFAAVVKSMKAVLTEHYGEEMADSLIAKCGRLAYGIEKDEDILPKKGALNGGH